MDIKKYYKEMSDDDIIERIEQYNEFNKLGTLKDCELREDISKFSKSINSNFSTCERAVCTCLLLEGSNRFVREHDGRMDIDW